MSRKQRSKRCVSFSKRFKVPAGLTSDLDPNSVLYSSKRQNDKGRSRGKKRGISDKDWILKKKELYRKRGVKTATDSQFTARKRRPRF